MTDHRNKGRCDCETCFYCYRPLARRHEHDHFPVPAEAGGTAWVPVCLTCHDLVDREDLTASVLSGWASLTPEARILVARGIKMWHRYRHRLEKRTSGRTGETP